MIRVSIIAIGRFGKSPERTLFDAYMKRLSWSCDLIELEDRKGGSDAERNARENMLLRDRAEGLDALIALDEAGKALSSREFAGRLQGFADSGRRKVGLLIGGAGGLDDATRGMADVTLSLGRMTWPHLLVRALLAEQLYRASAILSGHPYHRD